MTDHAPGTFPAPPALTGADPFDPANLPPKPDTAPDTKPTAKRPTTRAGREAARAAKAAAKSTKADTKPKSSTTSKPRKASLETRLTGSLVTLGTMTAAAGAMTTPALTADGVLICQHAPNIAAALDKVAKDDPRVAAALERMLTVGTWSGLVAAMLPLVLGIAANHGAIPPAVAAMLGADVPATPDAPAASSTPPAPETGVPVV